MESENSQSSGRDKAAPLRLHSTKEMKTLAIITRRPTQPSNGTNMKEHLSTAVLTLFIVVAALTGQNAAPSSHMVFNDNFEGDIIINEVRVPKAGEAMYTYYEALGWRGMASGYAGIQAHPKAHNYIFSIWDHKAHKAPIRAVHRGPGTLTEKFGGEGTGLKSWNFTLGWEVDTWYTLVSRCWPVGNHTYYAFWARSGKTRQWTHLVTMDVAAKNAFFQGGTDAFIEDWLETGKKPRTTYLRGGWKRRLNGQWHAFGRVRYSVNYWDLNPGKRSFNFKTNWNGGVAQDGAGKFYFMTAGGKGTKPATKNPSLHAISRTETQPNYVPLKIKTLGARWEKGRLIVEWENDPTTLPQFTYDITLEGLSKTKATGSVPHARRVVLNIDQFKKGKVTLSCTDILGNRSPAKKITIGNP